MPSSNADDHVVGDERDIRAASLTDGGLNVLGRLRGSSNATFLVEIGTEGLLGVYKPARGEQPLWDFPPGLWRREIAAYELSHATGMNLVPPTVHRSDGPFGEGSLQYFIRALVDEHYFTILPEASEDVLEQFRRLCAFDLIANSADRKAGHCLIDGDDRIWAIDNGLSFHRELKVRTVIWDFAGEPLPATERERLERLLDEGVPATVSRWLDDDEVDALVERTSWLLEIDTFPHDPTGRRYPWPLI